MPVNTKRLIVVLYALSALLIVFSIFTFLYQYIAALGSFSDVIAAFGNNRILTALLLSIASSIVTTILAIVFGVPLGWLFATKEFRGKSIVETLAIDVPQTFPPVAEGIIFLLMMGPNSPFHVNLAFTFAAIVISQFYVSAPFMVSSVARSFRKIKESGIDLTARSLGATPLQVFSTIFVPMGIKDIAAGTALCWSRAMGELGGTLIFAGAIPFATETIPTFIGLQARTLTIGALAATILATTASAIALVSFKKLTK